MSLNYILPKPGSHAISLDQAVAMTTLYRQNRENILQPQYQFQNILAICETFNKSDIQKLLNENGCEGFRIYYGMSADLQVHAILVGVDSTGADILLPSANDQGNGVKDGGDGDILEDGQRCPTYCPPDSPLNS